MNYVRKCRAAEKALEDEQAAGSWAESFLDLPKCTGSFADHVCPCCGGSQWLWKPWAVCPLCRGFGRVGTGLKNQYIDALRTKRRKSTQHDPRKNFHVAGKVSGRRYKCVVSDGS